MMSFIEVTGLGEKQSEYKIGSATYLVSSRFENYSNKTSFKDSIEKIITNDFTHLNIPEKDDKITVEMCLTAEKEDNNNAVNKTA